MKRINLILILTLLLISNLAIADFKGYNLNEIATYPARNIKELADIDINSLDKYDAGIILFPSGTICIYYLGKDNNTNSDINYSLPNSEDSCPEIIKTPDTEKVWILTVLNRDNQILIPDTSVNTKYLPTSNQSKILIVIFIIILLIWALRYKS